MGHRILITGTNRGIGLEFVQQYLTAKHDVIACCRNPENAQELRDLEKKYPNLLIQRLDVEKENDLKDLVKNLQSKPIDILINNAGIYGEGDQSFTNVTPALMLKVFNVNTVSPLLTIRALLPNVLLGKFKTVLTLSSLMGSITDNNSGGAYAYRASKAAVNMVMKGLAVDLQSQGVRVLSLHPGWVQTDMGGSKAPLNVRDSVSGLIQVIENQLKTSPNAKEPMFISYNGKALSW